MLSEPKIGGNSNNNIIQLDSLPDLAVVPEHSISFMQAMSGGNPFLRGTYLFLSSGDLLMAIGYPISGKYDPKEFDQALLEALGQTKAKECIAISPSLPERLHPHRREQDQYYTLPANAPIPSRLERLANRAASSLQVEEGKVFTLSHRRLWAEFVGREPLPPIVRKLYEKTETVLTADSDLILLNAWTEDGHLAACLLLDLAPKGFLSYIIGAHSRIHYTPYASDLLFKQMICIARREGKSYLHLGLGVNDGIRRFKAKWGSIPSLPYEMAVWNEDQPLSAKKMLQMLSAPPTNTMTTQQYLDSILEEKPFTMLWEIEKNGCRSWIGGTAHFFRYSFEASFRELFNHVHTVIFEGPLDQVSMEQVTEAGQKLNSGAPRLIDAMSEEEIRRLEKVVAGPQGIWARLAGLEQKNIPDVRYYLSETRPWLAFFSLWCAFLKRKGWDQSVDMEAWHLARDMGKVVFGMETIVEQIETLESIPFQRIVNFFRDCNKWNSYTINYERSYLQGELEAMLGTSAEFPSRTEMVICRRDETFLKRMLPFLEKGGCAVFVGAAHMLNLRRMIAEAGFNIRKTGKKLS
ncbi:MAG: TraB/GumN family protein [Syntrophomonadaceae bacterium]|nr:TraB/GumN family protein [Syntrophomonadaceae bacterium]